MRILLIDDHPIFSQGLKLLLAELDDTIETVVVGHLQEAIGLASEFAVVLLDFHLPDAEGFQGLQQMRQRFDAVPIIMLSSEDDPLVIGQLIADGAAGFIPKSSTPQVLIAALRLILSGGIYLPPLAFNLPTQSSPPTSLAASPLNLPNLGLTQRQLEVFLKLAQGKANKVIARELNLSEATVKTHVSTAFRVLGVNSRTEAVYKAAQLGLGLS